MYRDDRGGWVSASQLESQRYKVIGLDFRGLPIVHFGKGRPRTKTLRLLQKDPNSSPHSSTAGSVPTSSTSESCPPVYELTGEPRHSLRLYQKKLLQSEQTNNHNAPPDNTTTSLRSSSVTSSGYPLMTSQEGVYLTSSDGGEESRSCPAPMEIVQEVSIVSDETRKMFECTDCHVIFNSTGGYKRHLSSPDCLGFDSRCYLCHEMYTDQSALKIHEQGECYQSVASTQHLNVTLEQWRLTRYLCSLCGKGYSNEENLLTHAREFHLSSRIFRCRLCEQTYQELTTLRNHFTKTHQQHELVECHLCQKRFTSKRSLLSHVRNTHNSSLIFKCVLCEKDFKSKRSLNLHISGVHQNNKPFQCQTCNKCYTTKSGLDTHVKVHSESSTH
ncbi:hypothetical protein EB796_008268 [Bugula neritina]|uniref:C2H2-type domain-containing protein n=1 Tax=Bugula neritina TaxID=10212 RepID=A0A7J7K5B8_BUGNE|nr:hypothetical protein EB796_008268 [Bugula neritina]